MSTPVIEALLTSTAVVAFAEIGDKTQLLSFALAARLRRPWPIIGGILVATLANHALAGSVGVWIAHFLSPQVQRWTTAGAFFVFALWALHPDSLGKGDLRAGRGVFLTTVITFFIAEMGDKTQLATIALGARYQALVAVVLGTTLGMMIANVPAVFIGERLAERIPMHAMRWVAAATFAITGALALL